jgi:hypothetical protein
MNINTIITDLIKFNKENQIDTMIRLCKENPSSHLCRNVSFNNYEEWNNFFTIDNNKNLFAKGFQRLDTWTNLLSDPPNLYFTKEIIPKSPAEQQHLNELVNNLDYLKENKKETFYFILASLIIIFQVFGDANHRTANYFMKNMTYLEINKAQMNKINELLSRNDYYTIKENPIINMNNLINVLIQISHIIGGKKYKKRKYTVYKSKKRYFKKNTHRSIKRRTYKTKNL